MAKLRGLLDLAATVLLIAASVSVLWFVFIQSTSEAGGTKPYASGDDFLGGERLELPPEGAAIVLHLSSRCRFCTASMPLYRRLAAAENRPPIVVVGREEADRMRAYVTEHSFEPDRIVSVPEGLPRMDHTPALLIVTPDGKLRDVWIGQILERTEEDRLFRLIAEVTSATTNWPP